MFIPEEAIDAAHTARYEALMGPCCSDPKDMEAAVLAALRIMGIREETNKENESPRDGPLRRYISNWSARC